MFAKKKTAFLLSLFLLFTLMSAPKESHASSIPSNLAKMTVDELNAYYLKIRQRGNVGLQGGDPSTNVDELIQWGKEELFLNYSPLKAESHFAQAIWKNPNSQIARFWLAIVSMVDNNDLVKFLQEIKLLDSKKNITPRFVVDPNTIIDIKLVSGVDASELITLERVAKELNLLDMSFQDTLELDKVGTIQLDYSAVLLMKIIVARLQFTLNLAKAYDTDHVIIKGKDILTPSIRRSLAEWLKLYPRLMSQTPETDKSLLDARSALINETENMIALINYLQERNDKEGAKYFVSLFKPYIWKATEAGLNEIVDDGHGLFFDLAKNGYIDLTGLPTDKFKAIQNYYSELIVDPVFLKNNKYYYLERIYTYLHDIIKKNERFNMDAKTIQDQIQSNDSHRKEALQTLSDIRDNLKGQKPYIAIPQSIGETPTDHDPAINLNAFFTPAKDIRSYAQLTDLQINKYGVFTDKFFDPTLGGVLSSATSADLNFMMNKGRPNLYTYFVKDTANPHVGLTIDMPSTYSSKFINHYEIYRSPSPSVNQNSQRLGSFPKNFNSTSDFNIEPSVDAYYYRVYVFYTFDDSTTAVSYSEAKKVVLRSSTNNNAPVIFYIPPQVTITKGDKYLLQVKAVDPQGLALSWRLDTKSASPNGSSFSTEIVYLTSESNDSISGKLKVQNCSNVVCDHQNGKKVDGLIEASLDTSTAKNYGVPVTLTMTFSVSNSAGQKTSTTTVITIKPSPNQPKILTGTVVDSKNAPVASASVEIIDSANKKSTMQTNAKGEFVFDKFIQGNYRVNIIKKGYQTLSTSVTSTGNAVLKSFVLTTTKQPTTPNSNKTVS